MKNKLRSKCPFCGGSKVKPFTGRVGGQNCNECDNDGMIRNSRLEELELYDMIERPSNTKFSRKNLNQREKKIYDAVLKAFPATDPQSAYNVAINGGLKFQFEPK